MLFDFDKSNVKPEAAAILDRLVAFMNENKDKKAALAGHTDNIGTEAYNLKLSEQAGEFGQGLCGEEGR